MQDQFRFAGVTGRLQILSGTIPIQAGDTTVLRSWQPRTGSLAGMPDAAISQEVDRMLTRQLDAVSVLSEEARVWWRFWQ